MSSPPLRFSVIVHLLILCFDTGGPYEETSCQTALALQSETTTTTTGSKAYECWGLVPADCSLEIQIEESLMEFHHLALHHAISGPHAVTCNEKLADLMAGLGYGRYNGIVTLRGSLLAPFEDGANLPMIELAEEQETAEEGLFSWSYSEGRLNLSCPNVAEGHLVFEAFGQIRGGDIQVADLGVNLVQGCPSFHLGIGFDTARELRSFLDDQQREGGRVGAFMYKAFSPKLRNMVKRDYESASRKGVLLGNVLGVPLEFTFGPGAFEESHQIRSSGNARRQDPRPQQTKELQKRKIVR